MPRSSGQRRKELDDRVIVGARLECRILIGIEQTLFDTYNSSMVQLSDEHIREMYQCFMLVYVDEYEDATLERLGLTDDDIERARVQIQPLDTREWGKQSGALLQEAIVTVGSMEPNCPFASMMRSPQL